MNIENTNVYGFEDAIRGMRNPLNSWSNSDSYYIKSVDGSEYILGEKDKDLCHRLLSTPSDSDSKFLRMIYVNTDIVAPVYWVQELDTYKISTVRDSCSLQHRGMSRDYALHDFTLDVDTHVPISERNDENYDTFDFVIQKYIDKVINPLRKKYKETGDYRYFRAMRQALPMGYNYRFTWSANYAVLRNIYRQRKSHRLSEWHEFCKWIESLPYAEDLITYGIKKVC